MQATSPAKSSSLQNPSHSIKYTATRYNLPATPFLEKPFCQIHKHWELEVGTEEKKTGGLIRPCFAEHYPPRHLFPSRQPSSPDRLCWRLKPATRTTRSPPLPSVFAHDATTGPFLALLPRLPSPSHRNHRVAPVAVTAGSSMHPRAPIVLPPFSTHIAGDAPPLLHWICVRYCHRSLCFLEPPELIHRSAPSSVAQPLLPVVGALSPPLPGSFCATVVVHLADAPSLFRATPPPMLSPVSAHRRRHQPAGFHQGCRPLARKGGEAEKGERRTVGATTFSPRATPGLRALPPVRELR